MGWTDISAGRQDADSPIDEDLIEDIVGNTEYNHDCAVRSGTHASGVRRALGLVAKTFTQGSANSETVTVTFATDCVEDPNFNSAPYPLGQPVLLRNDTTVNDFPDRCWFLTMTSTGCTVRINYDAGSPNSSVTMYFGVVGEVTSGE